MTGEPANPNPYRPPAAPVSDPVVDRSAQRPVLVSVIAIYYGFSAILSIIARYLLSAHPGLVPTDMRLQLHSLTWVDGVVWTVAVSLKAWAAISLYRLNKYALVSLLMLAVVGAANTLRYILFKHWLTVTPAPALTGAAIGYLLSIVILVYVARLRGRGILRNERPSTRVDRVDER